MNLAATNIVLLVGIYKEAKGDYLRVQKTSVVLLNKNNIECGIET